MQFYLALWLDTDGKYTLEKLGEWEQENPFEYETYMASYVKMQKARIAAQKKAKQKARMRRRR